jgi:hypothetical protein
VLSVPHSVLNRRKHFFKHVPNVHGVHDVRQMDIHTAEQVVPEPSLVEMEIAIRKLKRYKSPGTDQISAELMKAGGEILRSEMHKLIFLYGIRRNSDSIGRNLLLCQFIERVIRLTVIIIEEAPSYELPTKFHPTFFWQG